MDITVKKASVGNEWSMVDLLVRSMGHIVEDPPGHFTIHPDGQAVETMAGLKHGPYASLDAALSEIETHTRGVCRMEEGSASDGGISLISLAIPSGN
ncbi:MAG: hypothetical protein QOJ04_3164 [Caballeronia sp.]|nr:hypothetical protein [Caballeronia sp.]